LGEGIIACAFSLASIFDTRNFIAGFSITNPQLWQIVPVGSAGDIF